MCKISGHPGFGGRILHGRVQIVCPRCKVETTVPSPVFQQFLKDKMVTDLFDMDLDHLINSDRI